MFAQHISQLTQFNTSDSSFLVQPRSLRHQSLIQKTEKRARVKLASKLSASQQRPPGVWNSQMGRLQSENGHELMMDGGECVSSAPNLNKFQRINTQYSAGKGHSPIRHQNYLPFESPDGSPIQVRRHQTQEGKRRTLKNFQQRILHKTDNSCDSNPLVNEAQSTASHDYNNFQSLQRPRRTSQNAQDFLNASQGLFGKFKQGRVQQTSLQPIMKKPYKSQTQKNSWNWQTQANDIAQNQLQQRLRRRQDCQQRFPYSSQQTSKVQENRTNCQGSEKTPRNLSPDLTLSNMQTVKSGSQFTRRHQTRANLRLDNKLSQQQQSPGREMKKSHALMTTSNFQQKHYQSQVGATEPILSSTISVLRSDECVSNGEERIKLHKSSTTGFDLLSSLTDVKNHELYADQMIMGYALTRSDSQCQENTFNKIADITRQADQIKRNNEVVFRQTLNKVGLMMGAGQPTQNIDPLTEYELHIPEFQAKFLSVQVASKFIPLILRVVQDEKKNQGTGLKNHDLEVYWSIENKYPSIQSNDGFLDNTYKSSLCVNIAPFGQSHFTTKNVFFGLYSKSGIYVRVGCSFKSDYYAAGQLAETFLKVNTKKVVEDTGEVNQDAMITSLLTPGMKQTEFKKTFQQAQDFMFEDKKVFTKFMNRVKIVKDKRDKEAKLRAYKKKLSRNFQNQCKQTATKDKDPSQLISEYRNQVVTDRRKTFEKQKLKLDTFNLYKNNYLKIFKNHTHQTKLKAVARDMSAQVWLRWFYLNGFIKHISQVYRSKKKLEEQKADRLWATMFIGKRFRNRLHRFFSKQSGVEEYMKLLRHEMREKAGDYGNVAEIEDLKISDMNFSERFKVLAPFIVKNRLKYCLTFEYSVRGQEAYIKGRSIIHEFLTFYKDGRQIILSFKNFFNRINTIRDRAILQIRLYKEVVRDVTQRMSVSMQLLTNRVVEHKNLQDKHPNFLENIDSISEIAKMQVISSLIEIHKFQHSIQIMRWMGLTYGKYNWEAWESISNALQNRIKQERSIMSAIAECCKETGHVFKMIQVLMQSKKNIKKLENIEDEFQKASIGTQSLTSRKVTSKIKQEEFKEQNFARFTATVNRAKTFLKKSEESELNTNESIEEVPQLTDDTIVRFCADLGLYLEPVAQYQIPKFRLELGKVNYSLLIQKALLIQVKFQGYSVGYATRNEDLKGFKEEMKKKSSRNISSPHMAVSSHQSTIASPIPN